MWLCTSPFASGCIHFRHFGWYISIKVKRIVFGFLDTFIVYYAKVRYIPEFNAIMVYGVCSWPQHGRKREGRRGGKSKEIINYTQANAHAHDGDRYMGTMLLLLLLLHVMCVRVKQFLLVQLITFVLSSDISQKANKLLSRDLQSPYMGSQSNTSNSHLMHIYSHAHTNRVDKTIHKVHHHVILTVSAILLPWVSLNFFSSALILVAVMHSSVMA